MGGEFPNGATTGPTRPCPIEDSRANPERLPLNFEGCRLVRRRISGAFHGPNPGSAPGSKCPAREGEPNKCTPQVSAVPLSSTFLSLLSYPAHQIAEIDSISLMQVPRTSTSARRTPSELWRR